jgi:hypothetical protein
MSAEQEVHRSSVTGQFVSEEEAAAHPETTTTETVSDCEELRRAVRLFIGNLQYVYDGEVARRLAWPNDLVRLSGYHNRPTQTPEGGDGGG